MRMHDNKCFWTNLNETISRIELSIPERINLENYLGCKMYRSALSYSDLSMCVFHISMIPYYDVFFLNIKNLPYLRQYSNDYKIHFDIDRIVKTLI